MKADDMGIDASRCEIILVSGPNDFGGAKS